MNNDTKYLNTPRGRKVNNCFALTQSELPWTPADYKTENNINKPISIERDLVGDT